MKFIKYLVCLFLFIEVYAQDDIPKTSGFSGFALLGPGYFNVENSLIVTGSPLLDDVGSPQIESIFDPPPSVSAPALLVGFELNYTFSSTRTQLYFGNRLEDLLRLDLLIGIGVRQELPEVRLQEVLVAVPR